MDTHPCSLPFRRDVRAGRDAVGGGMGMTALVRGAHDDERAGDPMNEPSRIHYWGAAGAGRTTTITKLTGTETGIQGDHDYHLHVSGRELVVRYSSVATKVFYRATDPARPQAIGPVIEQLAEAAGIIFVADSQSARRDHNIGWLARLRADLHLAGKDLDRIPVVFQLNKRDLSDIMRLEEMQDTLQTRRCAYIASIAVKGVGTKEALERLLAMLDEARA